jgi:hypothetical protein
MSDRKLDDARTIHPDCIAAVGEEVCLALLSVARDLRSGAIPPEHYYQGSWCGTAQCIWGHAATRLGRYNKMEISVAGRKLMEKDAGLHELFMGAGGAFASPDQAANAIESWLFTHAKFVWHKTIDTATDT